MNNKPWRHKWDRKALNGVIYPEGKRYERERYLKSTSEFKQFEKWDLMKHYRESIHDDDHKEIINDLKQFELEVQDKSEVVYSGKKLVRARKIPSDSS